MASKKLILVVDDEADIRNTVKSVLEKNGYSVVTAISADDCLKKIKAGEKPALILMDIMMPGTPVREIIPKLGNIKIAYLSVVRTSEAEKEDLMKSKNIVDFIQKPFDINELLKRVKKIAHKNAKKIIKKKMKKFPKISSKKIDMSALKADIEKALNSKDSKMMNHKEQIAVQRAPLEKIKNLKFKYNKQISKYVNTGIPGFDELFQEGIPKGSNVLVAGGAGSGKTIFCLQTLAYHAAKGEKCFYMSFEESEDKLRQHMKEFGWDADKMIKSGKLKIERINPFEITRNVDAMLAKEKGELLIELEPVILPKNFKPDFIVLDSLTAIASAFTGKEDSYRIYIEQLFRFFERLGSTSFLIAETKQIPEVFSTSGVEEFLADGVIVLYNIKRGDIRENAVEILKMRGEKHQKKIVAMQITDKGLIVYPEQEVFGGIGE